MIDWTEEEAKALRALIRRAETDPNLSRLFSKEDLLALKAAAGWIQGFQFLGRFGRWVALVLAAISGLFIAWEQFIARVVKALLP